MFGWLIGLKAKAIALGALILAICSGLLYERHRGKVEGEQIAAAKAQKEIETAARVSQVEIAKAAKLQPGEAQTKLQKDWSR